nr:MAG TPA: restriction enzyme [Caudoviricetes sp.]
MTPSEIKPGMKFGHWEVLKFDHVNKHRVKYFLCKCDVCGTIKPVRGTSLIDGTSTACSKICKNTLIGQKFGEWTVIRHDKSHPRYYICRCSCGTIKSVFSGSLKFGKTNSCGCLKNKHVKQKNKDNAESYIGEKYGKLTIVDYFLKGKSYWYKCRCDCGAEVSVIGKNLFNGNTYSCGCVNSKANELMDKILTQKRIPFKREVKFEDCCDKKPLPFDFAIYNEYNELLGLIELNGSLHYSASGTGWDTPERLIRQQKHDYIKRKFCEDNKIPFLIIPYQYFNDIEKFLETSDFWQIIIKNFND